MARDEWTRRAFLGGVTVGGGTWLVACATGSAARSKKEDEEGEVSPNEDLMREHGLLDRVMLVYEAAVRRIDMGQEVSPDIVGGSAAIVRHFIEDYHEKLEEDFLFPRFEQAGQQAELVAILREQHQAGRRVTDRILQLATPESFDDPAARQQLTGEVRQFIRMYRPHAAREDTVLFPAFRKLVTQKEYVELGERFEAIEHERFGAAGFEGVLAQVEALEREAGVADLAQFTPGVSSQSTR